MSRSRPPSGRSSSKSSSSVSNSKQLVEALTRGSLDDLEALLQSGDDSIKAICSDAQLDKLVVAANAGRREQQAWTPLHLACFHAPAAAVQLLLQHGAATSSKASPCGWTPALVACCRTDPAAALATLQALEQGGRSRLGKAQGTASCMSLALPTSGSKGGSKGSSDASSSSDARQQLLQWLVQNGAMPATMCIPAAQEVGRRLLLTGMAELLLPLMRKADPALAQGSTGFAGLFRGVAFCQEVPEAAVEAAVKLLMQPPFQVNAPLEAKDMTPGQAALRGHPCVLKLLLQAGLDVHARLDNMNTLLHFACNGVATNMNSHMPANVSLLLDAGSDPNVRNAAGELPLNLAINFRFVVPLLWPPVTKDAAEFYFEGTPVSAYHELTRASMQQMGRVQAAIHKSQAAADSPKATMVFHLLRCDKVDQLIVMLPLLSVPTPERRLGHGFIWSRYLIGVVEATGAKLVGGMNSNTGMHARGTAQDAYSAGRAQLKVAPGDIQTFVKFFREHPDVPALHYAVHLVRALKEAVCGNDSLVALMAAGLKAALAAKKGYLNNGRTGQELFDACARVVSTVCMARKTDVHLSPALFQPLVDAGHHLDLAAAFAMADPRTAGALATPLSALMAFQVVQVEVVEYWQQHPAGWQGVASVVHTLCDACEGKVAVTSGALVHDGVILIRGGLASLLYGRVIVGEGAPDTIPGSAWSPAWEQRLTAARAAVLQNDVLRAALERLGDVPSGLPDMKRNGTVSMLLADIEHSIRIARVITNKPVSLPAPSTSAQQPAAHTTDLNLTTRSAELNKGSRKCKQCGATSQPDGKALLVCPGCKETYYCGRECQLVNWKAVHKHQCKKK